MSDTRTRIEKSDEQWGEQLTPEQHDVLRRKDTEHPFTGSNVHTRDDGIFDDGPGGCDRYCINSVALVLDTEAAK